ncbi:hypothetical protein D3C72_2320120 [compost metagenome]
MLKQPRITFGVDGPHAPEIFERPPVLKDLCRLIGALKAVFITLWGPNHQIERAESYAELIKRLARNL